MKKLRLSTTEPMREASVTSLVIQRAARDSESFNRRTLRRQFLNVFQTQDASFLQDKADFAVRAKSFIIKDRSALTYPQIIADADQFVVVMPDIGIY